MASSTGTSSRPTSCSTPTTCPTWRTSGWPAAVGRAVRWVRRRPWAVATAVAVVVCAAAALAAVGVAVYRLREADQQTVDAAKMKAAAADLAKKAKSDQEAANQAQKEADEQ